MIQCDNFVVPHLYLLETLGFVSVCIAVLSFFVTLMVKDPADTHVNFDANPSQREYQIHFQPLTEAAFF